MFDLYVYYFWVGFKSILKSGFSVSFSLYYGQEDGGKL